PSPTPSSCARTPRWAWGAPKCSAAAATATWAMCSPGRATPPPPISATASTRSRRASTPPAPDGAPAARSGQGGQGRACREGRSGKRVDEPRRGHAGPGEERDLLAHVQPRLTGAQTPHQVDDIGQHRPLEGQDPLVVAERDR